MDFYESGERVNCATTSFSEGVELIAGLTTLQLKPSCISLVLVLIPGSIPGLISLLTRIGMF
jgi:hypothetical protein